MVRDKLQALRKSFLFSSVDKNTLPKIAQICQSRAFHKNELIFQEGDEARGFFIVSRGEVKLYKLSASGDEHILHMIAEGGSFAEAVAFGRLPKYPAFAEAITQSEILFISTRDFLSLIKSDFSVVLSVLGSMSEKLKVFNAVIEELSLKSADARVAKYLLDLSFKKKSDSFILDVKKLELAKKLGIVPETLSRIFKKLIKKRILNLQKSHITLRDEEKLRRIASGENLA